MEKPIIFSGEMARAIIDGRKTQTRRVMKRNAPKSEGGIVTWYPGGEKLGFKYVGVDGHSIEVPGGWGASWCPYGYTGDRLWVRETFAIYGAVAGSDDPVKSDMGIIYKADTNDSHSWRSPIFMPRWASRITLEVTGISVDRVQNIREEDARAEGVPQCPAHLKTETPYRVEYERVWNEINSKRGYSWQSNPWVFVISFNKLTP